jgi:hypothetical protein
MLPDEPVSSREQCPRPDREFPAGKNTVAVTRVMPQRTRRHGELLAR